MIKSIMNKLNPKVVLGVAAHPDDLDFGHQDNGRFCKEWGSRSLLDSNGR